MRQVAVMFSKSVERRPRGATEIAFFKACKAQWNPKETVLYLWRGKWGKTLDDPTHQRNIIEMSPLSTLVLKRCSSQMFLVFFFVLPGSHRVSNSSQTALRDTFWDLFTRSKKGIVGASCSNIIYNLSLSMTSGDDSWLRADEMWQTTTDFFLTTLQPCCSAKLLCLRDMRAICQVRSRRRYICKPLIHANCSTWSSKNNPHWPFQSWYSPLSWRSWSLFRQTGHWSQGQWIKEEATILPA